MCPRRVPRADARENRARLLQAGEEVLIQAGPGATVAAIADRAGVSVSSFFTYFASKDDLVAVLLTERLEAARSIAERHARASGPAIERLAHYLQEACADVAPHRVYFESVRALRSPPTASHAPAQAVEAAVGRIVADAHHEGTLRPDVTALDILGIVAIATHAAAPYLHARPQLWRRFAAFFIAGLRTTPARELPR